VPRQTGPSAKLGESQSGFTLSALTKGLRDRRARRRGGRGAAATLLGGYLPTVCGREVAMARRSNLARPSRSFTLITEGTLAPRHCSRPAKIMPVVASKCASGRPLLTGTASQTEFALTHSKQTTEKFLTGARTHIKVFEFLSFTTQNLAQLIQRHHHVTPRRLPALRLPNSSAIMICFKRGRLDSH
jgi:hypothetical protein